MNIDLQKYIAGENLILISDLRRNGLFYIPLRIYYGLFSFDGHRYWKINPALIMQRKAPRVGS